MFADDTTLFASSNTPTNIEYALNKDLEQVSKWFQANKLRLNVKKTKFMVVYPRNMGDRFEHVNIFIMGQHVEREANVKILGVTLNEELKWHQHMGGMIRNLRFQYRAFGRSIKYFDRDTRLIVYNSSLASRFNYADCIWDQCTLKEAKQLQSVQNMAVKKMMNAAPLTSAKPLIRNLGLLTLETKRKLRSLVLLYKLTRNEGPAALIRELEGYRNSSREHIITRNSGEGSYYIPAYNTDNVGKSFFVQTIKRWNTLPTNIQQSENATIFKRRVYDLLLTAEADADH